MSITKKTRAKDTYLDLVKRFPLVPIKNERHYDEAATCLKKLAIRDENSLTSGKTDYLDALTLFVEAYQTNHHALDAAQMPPLQALHYLMHESNTTTADLGRLLGNSSLASQILNGRRQLSKSHIITLAQHFHVEPGLFL